MPREEVTSTNQEVAKEEVPPTPPVGQTQSSPKLKRVANKKKRRSLDIVADSVKQLSSELKRTESYVASFEKKLATSIGNVSNEVVLIKTRHSRDIAEAEKKQRAQLNRILGSIRNYQSSMAGNAKLQIEAFKKKYPMAKKTKKGKKKK